jgi:hypothetical protein
VNLASEPVFEKLDEAVDLFVAKDAGRPAACLPASGKRACEPTLAMSGCGLVQ